MEETIKRMEARERLTVLKEYMTPDDMLDYFGFKSTKTFGKWEQEGLRAIRLSERTKFYRADDIRNFLNKH